MQATQKKKKFRRFSIQPGLRGSNDLRVGRKMTTFQLFFQSGRAKDLSAPLYFLFLSIPSTVLQVNVGRGSPNMCQQNFTSIVPPRSRTTQEHSQRKTFTTLVPFKPIPPVSDLPNAITIRLLGVSNFALLPACVIYNSHLIVLGCKSLVYNNSLLKGILSCRMPRT